MGRRRRRCKELAQRLNVAERVRFLGWVSDEDKFTALASADVFVSTSQHEGFGLMYLEAMACGLPVVTYDNGGQTDFLQDGETGGLIPVNDLAAFEACLRRLLGDEGVRSRIAATNRRIFETLTIENCAASTRRRSKPCSERRESPQLMAGRSSPEQPRVSGLAGPFAAIDLQERAGGPADGEAALHRSALRSPLRDLGIRDVRNAQLPSSNELCTRVFVATTVVRCQVAAASRRVDAADTRRYQHVGRSHERGHLGLWTRELEDDPVLHVQCCRLLCERRDFLVGAADEQELRPGKLADQRHRVDQQRQGLQLTNDPVYTTSGASAAMPYFARMPLDSTAVTASPSSK